MKSFLYILFSNVKRFFLETEFKTLLWLSIKYGHIRRYKRTTVKFKRFKFDIPDFMSFFWQYLEIYVNKSYLFRTNNYETVILDCGSNVGLSCLYFSENYPKAKIIGFEADANICKMAKGNMERNGVNNVELLNKAVWIHNDGIEFHVEGVDGGSIINRNENAVKMASIDLLEELNKYDRIGMMKMDIEGAEVKVIKHCRSLLHKCENIFIEYHSFKGLKQDLHTILSILEENGFRYYTKERGIEIHPLWEITKQGSMDMQINIFAYKL